MDKSSPTSPKENQSSPEGLSSQSRREDLSKLPKQTFADISSKTSEYIDLGESAEIGKEVSEAVSDQSEQKGDGTKPSSSGFKSMSPAQIRAELLKQAPSHEVMLKQVKNEIEKEIRYLHKRAQKIMRKPGGVNAFELNNIVKKIRELKTLLIALMRATADVAKTLWLRFVRGVM